MLKVFKPITKGLTSKATRAETLISLVVVSVLVSGGTVAAPIVYRQITKSNTGLTAIDKPAEQPKPLRPVDTSQETDNPDTIDQTDLTGSEPIPVDTSSPEAFRQNTIAEYERQRGQREALERLNALRAPLSKIVAFEHTDQATRQKGRRIDGLFARGQARLDELQRAINRCEDSINCLEAQEAYDAFRAEYRPADVAYLMAFHQRPCVGPNQEGMGIVYDFPDQGHTTDDSFFVAGLAEAKVLLAKAIPTSLEGINSLTAEFEAFKDTNNGQFGVAGNWQSMATGTEFYHCQANLYRQYDESLLSHLDW